MVRIQMKSYQISVGLKISWVHAVYKGCLGEAADPLQEVGNEEIEEDSLPWKVELGCFTPC